MAAVLGDGHREGGDAEPSRKKERLYKTNRCTIVRENAK